jgi:hypothetical protein
MLERSLVTVLLVVSTLLLAAAGVPAQEAGEDGSAVFICEGRSILNPQNLNESRRKAMDDLMSQGVTEALAKVLEHRKLAEHYDGIREAILEQPDRYVQQYQIVHQGASDPFYRVLGEVAVDLELLRADLRPLAKELWGGGLLAEAPARDQTPAPSGAGPGAAEGGPAWEATGQPVYWAVVEKWRQGGWEMPAPGDETRMADALAYEAQDFRWYPVFPRLGVLSLSDAGIADPEEVRMEARSAGAKALASGTIAFVEEGDDAPRISVRLKVHTGGAAGTEREISREQPVRDSSLEEAAMELAAVLAPEVERLVRRAEPSGTAELPQTAATGETGEEIETAETGEMAPPAETAEVPEGWTVVVRNYRPGAWDAVTRRAREGFREAAVKALEFEGDKVSVQLAGVDAGLSKYLEGTPFGRDGRFALQVKATDAATRTLELSVNEREPAAASQSEE